MTIAYAVITGLAFVVPGAVQPCCISLPPLEIHITLTHDMSIKEAVSED
jgi:hypothetical protein